MLAVLALSLCFVQSDRSLMTDGVVNLTSPGALPSAVIATKPAFVVLQTSGAATAAAGPVGQGRAFIVGHSVFFSDGRLVEYPSNFRMFKNSLEWLSRKPLATLRVGLIGIDAIDSVAQKAGIHLTAVSKGDLKSLLPKLDVLMMGQDALNDDPEDQTTVISWVKEGHGLYCGGAAWGWHQNKPEKSVANDLSVNKMLIPYGLGISEEITEGSPTVAGADNPLLETTYADSIFRSGQATAADLAIAKRTLARAFSIPPAKVDDGAPR